MIPTKTIPYNTQEQQNVLAKLKEALALVRDSTPEVNEAYAIRLVEP